MAKLKIIESYDGLVCLKLYFYKDRILKNLM